MLSTYRGAPRRLTGGYSGAIASEMPPQDAEIPPWALTCGGITWYIWVYSGCRVGPLFLVLAHRIDWIMGRRIDLTSHIQEGQR